MRHDITKISTCDYGETYKVSLQIPFLKGWIEHVKFCIWRRGVQKVFDMNWTKNENDYAYFEVIVDLQNCPLYHYYFSFIANGKFQYYKNEKKVVSGSTTIRKEECYKKSVNFNVPDWAKGAVGYHIFPDRFNKGKGTSMTPMPRRRIHENWYEQAIIEPDGEEIYNNDFFGGNFRGIKEKVSYIASLGVDIVYLNPIVKSQSNHRYDTADYFEPDPYLGTVEELKEMIDEFHKFGIKVIFDGVFNHTGNDSRYFNQYGSYDSIGAYQNPESPYRDFYEWNSNGKARTWWGFENLPITNKSNPRFIDMICGNRGVIDVWCDWGIDGIRLDVMDELPDHFIIEINKAMKRNKSDNFIIYGEVWENAERKGRNYINNDEAHSVMNYYLMDPLLRYYMYGDICKLDKNLREILTEYPSETILTLMNSTSTHDMSRCIELPHYNIFNYSGKDYWDINWKGMSEEEKYEWQKKHKLTEEQYEYSKIVMKSYLTALAFMPGMFTIFYGDEVGVQGIGNLLNRATYPWGKEDLELLSFYKELIKSRKSEAFLRKADMRVLFIDQNHLMFERFDDNEQAIVITSRVNVQTQIAIPEEYKNAKVIFSNGKNSKKNLAPYGAIVLKK